VLCGGSTWGTLKKVVIVVCRWQDDNFSRKHADRKKSKFEIKIPIFKLLTQSTPGKWFRNCASF
jgi:hypothetical protein